MSKRHRQGVIAVAFVAALSCSRAASAQSYHVHPAERGPLVQNIITGAQYDIVNQAKAERHLRHAQTKVQKHAQSGNTAAVDHDIRRINNLKFRITVDEWLIRKNSCQDPGYYPYPVCLDPISYCAIAQYHQPGQVR